MECYVARTAQPAVSQMRSRRSSETRHAHLSTKGDYYITGAGEQALANWLNE
jgi:hypothetical protein